MSGLGLCFPGRNSSNRFVLCLSALAALWTFACASSAHAQPGFVQFALGQLDYSTSGSLTDPFTEWGAIHVIENPPTSAPLRFVNLILNPGPNQKWALRNLPLLPTTATGTLQREVEQIVNLETTRGVQLTTPFPISYSVGLQPIADLSSYVPTSFGTLFPTREAALTNNGVPSNKTAVSTATITINVGAGPFSSIEMVHHTGMPNVVQELNYCGPGAAANSLTWLAQQHGYTIPPIANTQSELANDMGNTHNGNWDDAEVSGKQQFINDHNLPLEVHYAGGEKLPQNTAITSGWLIDQMKKGQDIEFMTETHWVVVESIVVVNGKVVSVGYRDDNHQHGNSTTTGEQQEINNRHSWSPFHENNDGSVDVNIGNGAEELLAVVCESPKTDLALAPIIATPPGGPAGTPVQYDTAVHNQTNDVATGVILDTDLGPNPLRQVVSAVPTQGSCITSGTHEICFLGTVPAQTTVGLSLAIQENAIGDVHTVITAHANQVDSMPADNTQAVSILLIPPPVHIRPIYIAAYQLDYYTSGSLQVPDSEWTELRLDYACATTAPVSFANVMLDLSGGTTTPLWAVRNMPLLPPNITGHTTGTARMQALLGNTRGTAISHAGFQLELTTVPLISSESFVSQIAGTIPVSDGQQIINSGVPSLDYSLHTVPAFIPVPITLPTIEILHHPDMPNVPQKENYCGPGAAINSLYWLAAQNNYTLPDDAFQEECEIGMDMGNSMDGNWDDAEVSGKEQYISDHGLPLEVHYAGGEMLPETQPITSEWLIDQMNMGQDLEMMTATHWVVIESLLVLDGQVVGVEFRDDPYQHGMNTTDDEADDIADRHTWSPFEENEDGSVTVDIGNGAEELLTIVAESPIEAGTTDVGLDPPSISGDPTSAGGSVEITDTIVNRSASTAFDVDFATTIPIEMLALELHSVGPCITSGSVLRCDIGQLLPGEHADVHMTLQPLSVGNFAFPLTVSTPTQADTNPTDNQVQVAVHSLQPQKPFIVGGGVTLKQLDYYLSGTLAIANSEWAELGLRYGSPGTTPLGFANVLIDPNDGVDPTDDQTIWAIRNMPLLPSSETSQSLREAIMATNLQTTRGVVLSEAFYELQITTAPLISLGSFAADTTGILQFGKGQENLNSGVPSDDQSLHTGNTFIGPLINPLPDMRVIHHRGMGNIIQKLNYCGPGAAINSLYWLATVNDYSLPDDEFQQECEIGMDMHNPSGPNGGNWDDAEVDGKAQYISDHNLPLEVHYAGGEKLPETQPITSEWLIDQMEKGQDLEMMTATHWVVIESILVIDGEVTSVEYRDDPYQHGMNTTDEEAEEIDGRHEWSPFTENDDGSVTVNIGNGDEDLLTIVAESPASDLILVDVPNNNPVFAGGLTDFGVGVSNGSPTTAHGVVVTQVIPLNSALDSFGASIGSCTATTTAVMCNVGELATSASATVNVRVRALSAGQIQSVWQATAQEGDLNPADNVLTQTRTVLPPFTEANHDNFDSPNIQPTGSSTGWSVFGATIGGIADSDYDSTQGAYIARIHTDPSRFRVTGWTSNRSEWLPYSAVGSENYVRVKYYLYAAGQANPAQLNQIPNIRVRAAHRFAQGALLEVLSHTNSDPANAAIAAELHVSNVVSSPSLYRVDFDPVDVPYLVSNSSVEGIMRAFESYSLDPQDNGIVGMTESVLGTYPAAAADDPNGPVKVYQPSLSDAGELKLFNSATELVKNNLIPGTVIGQFATVDNTTTQPSYFESIAGVTLDSTQVPANRIGLIAKTFTADNGSGNFAVRVRVEEGRQYKVRYHVVSTQQSNLNSQMRLRAYSLKFAYTNKLEIGGAQGTGGTANNSIAQQSLPGVGCQNPDRLGSESGGWYTLLMCSPMDRDIRGELGGPLSVRMPNITALPGPGVNSPSVRDLRITVDLIDTLSNGPLRDLEGGNFTVDRIEVTRLGLVSD